MKTNQMMKREFFTTKIKQRTDNSFFSATDLLKVYNNKNKKKKQIADFLKLKQTKDFMNELATDLNINAGKNIFMEKDLIITSIGRDGGTFMQPYLFVKFAMWLSPKFEVQVMKWITDNLIDFRKQAGDHYKEMCSTIQQKYNAILHKNPSPLIFSKEARFLNKLVFGTEQNNQRNNATPQQLDLMNRLQLLNIKLINENNNSKIDRHTKIKEFAKYFCQTQE
jgi:hypothetical protein